MTGGASGFLAGTTSLLSVWMPDAKVTDAQAYFTNWKAWNKFAKCIQGLRKAAESIGRIGGQNGKNTASMLMVSLWLARTLVCGDVDEAEQFLRNTFEKDLTVPIPSEDQSCF